MGTLFESRRDKAAEGDGSASLAIFHAQRNHYCPNVLYGNPLHFKVKGPFNEIRLNIVPRLLTVIRKNTA